MNATFFVSALTLERRLKRASVSAKLGVSAKDSMTSKRYAMNTFLLFACDPLAGPNRQQGTRRNADDL